MGERLRTLIETGALTRDDVANLRGELDDVLAAADHRVENVVGLHALPWAVATNFLVNGREVLVPMAIEEPSVVAAASHAAKLVRASGGFAADADPHRVWGQIQVVGCRDWDAAEQALLGHRERLLEVAAAAHPTLARRGGGPRALAVRPLNPEPDTETSRMLIVELLVDTRDAMGANVVNTMMERLAPIVESLSGGQTVCRILSNYADQCLGRATCTVDPDQLAAGAFSGPAVRDRIVLAYQFAASDVRRAVTHNKGIMNGVDGVVVATGNDWRAVEAGAHAYAARSGRYRSLSTWRVDQAGRLVGRLELPLALGTVGPSIQAQPTARTALALLGHPDARALAGIAAAVGLAQNLAALKALVTDGIQRGHMRLHARSVALAAGAPLDQVDALANLLMDRGWVTTHHARAWLRGRL